jgi:hypothetical protein
MKVTIDLEQLTNIVQKADGIVFSPEAENVLVQLYEIKQKVEEAEKTAKKLIEETALKYDPNFTSIQSDKLRVSYRAYGSRYSIDESHLADIPEGLYKKVVKYSPVAKAIEAHADEKGMPLGIVENERKKQVSITMRREAK